MSVINKMLRDLDQRQVPDDNGAAKPGATPLRSGTASVSGVPVAARRPRRTGLVVPSAIALALLAACAGAAWWWVHKAPAAQAVAEAVPLPMPAPVVAAAPTPAASAALAASQAPVQVASAPGTATKSANVVLNPAPVSAPALAPAPASTQVLAKPVPLAAAASAVPTAPATALPVQTLQTPLAPMAPSTTAAAPSSLSVQASPATAKLASTVPAVTPVAASTSPDSVTTGQRQQQAARDALAQAQGLWNAGAHDNAIDLLQQAVATAERSAHSTPGAPATQALTALARELARMQVAQGRAGASVDMLARLEPLLGGDADLWAVRANAAQRAGRHQDSVNAYTTALQSRPNEQRWLLGAAVSSAAMGQTSNAAAFADKAAAVGPIAKDVQAYLRQMGVPLKD